MLAGGAPSALAAGFPSAGRTVADATKPPGYVIANSTLTAPHSDFNTMGTASCPAGTVTWGGGMYFESYQIPTSSINSSYWNGSSPGGWTVHVNNTGSGSDTVVISAICAKKPSKYQLVSTTVDDPSGAQTSGVATCPAKTSVIGGGTGISVPGPAEIPTAANPNPSDSSEGQPSEWVTISSNALDVAVTDYAYAICAN
jgi:hypothetical protein